MIDLRLSDLHLTIDPGLTADGRPCKVLTLKPADGIQITFALEPDAAQTAAAALLALPPKET